MEERNVMEENQWFKPASLQGLMEFPVLSRELANQMAAEVEEMLLEENESCQTP